MAEVTGLCGRCGKELHGPAEEELCIFCEGNLCRDCWEEFGWCPHPGADEWQQRFLAASPEEKRRMMLALPPIGKPLVKRSEH